MRTEEEEERRERMAPEKLKNRASARSLPESVSQLKGINLFMNRVDITSRIGLNDIEDEI